MQTQLAQPVRHQLSEGQFHLALHMAMLRRKLTVDRGLRDTHGKDAAKSDPKFWGADPLSLMAEISVAEYLNLYWDGSLGFPKAFDVGGLIEVRSVSAHPLKLIVHKEEKEKLEFPAVKVVVDPPVVWMCGWVITQDVLLDQYIESYRTGGRAHFIPNHLLYPMETLKDWVEENRHRRVRY